MAKYDPEKKLAYSLFSEGHSFKYANSKMPHVSERSVRRWHEEYINSGGKDSFNFNAVVTAETQRTPEEWVSYAEEQSTEILTSNVNVRGKIEKLLLEQLDQEHINYRALGCLVSSMAIIEKQIWLFGSFSYLDVNKAAKLLSSMGFIITDPSGKLTGDNDG